MSVVPPHTIPRHADAESAKRLVRRVRGCRGFSLIEMVVSLAVVSVLLVGMTSAVVLASRALPTNDGPAAAHVESARVLHQLRDDLRAATELLNRTTTSVTVVLPDRDGDGRPEVVTYAWAGTPGDPLMRSANGGTPVAVLDTLESFALAYTTADTHTVFPGAVTTSTEQLLSSFSTSDTSGTLDHQLSPVQWIGTTVNPSLPAGATTWRISRALFYGSKSGSSNGTITFELRGSSGSAPTSTVLDSNTLVESDMTAWNWYETTFDSPTFAATDSACLVLANYGSGDTAGKWSYYTLHTPPSAMLRSNDGGASWLMPGTTEELQHFVYGTYQFVGDDWSYIQPRVTDVAIELIHDNATTSMHRLTVPLPNTPDAVDGLWEADFNADPTTLDLAQRAESDWNYVGGFPAGDLADGRWTLTAGLESEPRNRVLDQPATVRAVMSDTTDDGINGGVELRVERDGGDGGIVRAVVGLAGSQQTLLVSGYNGATGGFDIWINKTYNADEKVDLKLYIDPAEDTLGVVVNGEVCGSFVYDVVGVNSVSALVTVAGNANSGVRLDHLRMTLGGTTAITPRVY